MWPAARCANDRPLISNKRDSLVRAHRNQNHTCFRRHLFDMGVDLPGHPNWPGDIAAIRYGRRPVSSRWSACLWLDAHRGSKKTGAVDLVSGRYHWTATAGRWYRVSMLGGANRSVRVNRTSYCFGADVDCIGRLLPNREIIANLTPMINAGSVRRVINVSGWLLSVGCMCNMVWFRVLCWKSLEVWCHIRTALVARPPRCMGLPWQSRNWR